MVEDAERGVSDFKKYPTPKGFIIVGRIKCVNVTDHQVAVYKSWVVNYPSDNSGPIVTVYYDGYHAGEQEALRNISQDLADILQFHFESSTEHGRYELWHRHDTEQDFKIFSGSY